jgi:hypothetical protein
MKKREFLAMGGAVPLMLAGCGGNGSGSAPVRLVNASVGYPTPGLGFMDEANQITTGVTYGNASAFSNIEAGSVHLTLTTTINGAETSATAAQLRTVNKDQRYSLVAYGVLDQLRFALVAESTVTLDANTASVNVLNTSVDIGPVDVYLSPSTDLSVSTLIASSIAATSTSPAQSAFATDIQPGSYFITVVGANSVAQGISDVRFQTPVAVTLTALQILTVILTPGAGGVLANAILLTQGTTATTPTTSYENTTARVRAVTAVPGASVGVAGVNPAGAAVTVLAASTTQQYSNYFVVTTGTPPVVTVAGNPVSVVMNDPASTAVPPAEIAASLDAGGDYTLMVYLDGSGAPKAKVIVDDNTAPVTSSGLKFRLVNLASDNQGLQLSMLVNKQTIASNITYAAASNYKEISVPQGTSSTVQVNSGAQAIISETTPLILPNIFTEIVVSVDPSTGKVLSFFSSASGAD